jgi:hypothetical protein
VKHHLPEYEFETEILDGGMLRLSAPAAVSFRKGARVVVRISAGPGLRTKGITESEIGRIAALQMTDRARVVRMLQAEGMLAGNKSFRERARRTSGRTK